VCPWCNKARARAGHYGVVRDVPCQCDTSTDANTISCPYRTKNPAVRLQNNIIAYEAEAGARSDVFVASELGAETSAWHNGQVSPGRSHDGDARWIAYDKAFSDIGRLANIRARHHKIEVPKKACG